MKTFLLNIIVACCIARAAGAEPPASIILIGEIRSPSVIAYSGDMTLTTAILNAGGFADCGATQVYLIRNGAVVSHPNIRRIIEDPKRDIPLKPWDIISVGNIHPFNTVGEMNCDPGGPSRIDFNKSKPE